MSRSEKNCTELRHLFAEATADFDEYAKLAKVFLHAKDTTTALAMARPIDIQRKLTQLSMGKLKTFVYHEYFSKPVAPDTFHLLRTIEKTANDAEMQGHLDECDIFGHLRTLNVRRGNTNLQEVIAALPGSAVEMIKFWLHDTLTAQDIRLLGDVLPNTEVRSLSFELCRIQDESLIALSEALPHTKLTDLTLDRMINQKIPLGYTKKDFNDSYIGMKGFEALTQALSRSSLQRLCLPNNNLGPEAARLLAQGVRHSLIKELILDNNHFGPEGAKVFGPAIPETVLHTLSLNNNDLKDEGFIAIVDGSNYTTLKALHATHNGIGALPLNNLPIFLQELDISFNSIDGVAALHFTRLLRVGSLQSLNLYRNNITDRYKLEINKEIGALHAAGKNITIAM